MAIDRRRFLALPAIGVPAMVIGKRLDILAWLKSYFSASPSAESIPNSLLPLELAELGRAHLVSELHDSALQSMIAIEIRLDILRRQSLAQSNPLASELGRLQGLILEECLKHQELMRQMNFYDLDSSTFIRFIKDTVGRFQRETGINARFVSELDEVKMPRRVCRELALIVQEGLVNVRKFSVAREVLVRITAGNHHWCLAIEDNGRGYPFSGRFSLAELEEMGKGPMVIRERVRLIGGELTVESSPGRGSRLVVTVPQRHGVDSNISPKRT